MEVLIESELYELYHFPLFEVNHRASVAVCLRFVVLAVELEQDPVIAVSVIRIKTVYGHYVLIRDRFRAEFDLKHITFCQLSVLDLLRAVAQ